MGLVGPRRKAPPAKDGWLRVSGTQFCPASVVFKTPPSAPPRYTPEGLVGSTANALTRPEKKLLKYCTGDGPMEVHCVVLIARLVKAPLLAAAPVWSCGDDLRSCFSFLRISSSCLSALSRGTTETFFGFAPCCRAKYSARRSRMSAGSVSLFLLELVVDC